MFMYVCRGNVNSRGLAMLFFFFTCYIAEGGDGN